MVLSSTALHGCYLLLLSFNALDTSCASKEGSGLAVSSAASKHAHQQGPEQPHHYCVRPKRAAASACTACIVNSSSFLWLDWFQQLGRLVNTDSYMFININ